MSKIIDITDKLNFEEKPVFKVKNVKVEANNDAITMLKVIALYDDKEDGGEDISVGNILKIFNLLFDEKNQKKVESLKLNMEDFITFVSECANGIILDGQEPDEGETKTPATT